MKVKSESEVAQLCPTLWDPMDCSPPGSSVYGIFQAKVLEWGAIAFSKRSSWPRDWILGTIVVHNAPESRQSCLVTQSCPTLCASMDYSLPGSPIHGILQARILEWVAISFSKRSSWPRDWIWVSWINRRILYHWATREAQVWLAQLFSFPYQCDQPLPPTPVARRKEKQADKLRKPQPGLDILNSM